MLKISLDQQTTELLFFAQNTHYGLVCGISVICTEEIALYSLKIKDYQRNSYYLPLFTQNIRESFSTAQHLLFAFFSPPPQRLLQEL